MLIQKINAILKIQLNKGRNWDNAWKIVCYELSEVRTIDSKFVNRFKFEYNRAAMINSCKKQRYGVL